MITQIQLKEKNNNNKNVIKFLSTDADYPSMITALCSRPSIFRFGTYYIH